MKFPSFSRLVLTLSAYLLAVTVTSAEDLAPPYVAKPIANISVSAKSGVKKVSLANTFLLKGISGPVVRFTTTVGTVDVGLLSKEAPRTVSTFLRYVNSTRSNGNGVYTYNNTLIQRAVPSSDPITIVQGGGFYIDSQKYIDQIVGRPTIPSEAGVQNTRGTIAMALAAAGPGSATGDWFFNVVDNPVLDGTLDNGPFTVFGKVVGSTDTLAAIEALQQCNLYKQLGQGWENVPLRAGANPSSPTIDDLIYNQTITPISLIATKAGMDSILKLKVKNSNKPLVTAQLVGNQLVLTPVSGETGTAKIRVIARTKTSGMKAVSAFNYTVK